MGLYGDDSILTIAGNSCVGIAQTNPQFPLHVSGGSSQTLGSGGTSYNFWMTQLNSSSYSSVNYTGIGPISQSVCTRFDNNITVNGAIFYTSDRRLKNNIADIDINESSYMKLKPRSYTYKADEQQKARFGLVAQEIIGVCSEMVSLFNDEMMDDGIRMCLDYNQLSVINLYMIKIGCSC